MTIAEMHVWFRQYAQQMGMQNVRAILPEQIDLLINTSINDIINQLFRENIGITNDRIITDNSKIGQINAFRTLYRVQTIDMSPPAPSNVGQETRAFVFTKDNTLTGKMTTYFPKVSDNKLIPDYLYIVDFSLNYKKVSYGYSGEATEKGVFLADANKLLNNQYVKDKDLTSYNPYNANNDSTLLGIEVYASNSATTPETITYWRITGENTLEAITTNTSSTYMPVTLHDVSGTPKYILDDTGLNPIFTSNVTYTQPMFDGIETNYFPVRLIDDMYLADTLNDFVLRNRLRSPIIVTYNDGTFDLYIDEFKKHITAGIEHYTLDYDLVPYQLRMSYIAKPAVVKYAADITGVNVDCNLPESMHVDILKHAVDLYNTSVQGNLYSQQQQQQAQQREQARNQVRPENEGYKN